MNGNMIPEKWAENFRMWKVTTIQSELNPGLIPS